MNMNDFRDRFEPALDAPVPNFLFLLRGQRLSYLTLWQMAEQGRIEEVMPALIHAMHGLRIRLAQADTLIYKMVMASMLAENLNMQALMATAYRLAVSQHVAPLTIKERSLRLPALREFASEAFLYRQMDKSEDFFEKGGRANGLWVRALFKPNMTLNRSYPHWDSLVRNSEAEYENAAKQMAESKQREMDDVVAVQYRNYVGSVLGQVARPDYTDYIYRLLDLNLKIHLLNHLGQVQQAVKAVDFSDVTLKSPYDNTPPYLEPSGTKVCFKGVRSDERSIRCIPTTFGKALH